MRWLEHLFAHVDKIDRDFRFRVKGASDDEIEQVERAMGVPVPQVHQEYLRTMGRNDGGLFRSSRARTNVPAILELIECIKEENSTADFERFVPIAIGDAFEGWALVQKDGELPVVLIDHTRPGAYVARSLPHLALYTAFGWRIKAAAHQVRFRVRADETQLVQPSERAAWLGFSPEWFCDHLSYFGVRPDSLLQIHPGTIRGFDGFVAAQDVATARQLAEGLAEPFLGVLTFER
ncbi:MAG: SMI1/KNR4 family protein [Deltaproteobacteria bacterium]|nr:SMI1/KNR4 family protein [Deltaproteobacteria bacterium]